MWSENREITFNSIKSQISEQCLLNFPDWNRGFIIETGASKVAVSGVLMQEDENGKRKILGYHSSTLDPCQRTYSLTELECWAVISACRKFM